MGLLEMMPSDAELLTFASEEQFILFASQDEVLDIMKTTLQKYYSEQQTNYMAVVASVERERDTAYSKQAEMCAITAEQARQLAAVTKERDAYAQACKGLERHYDEKLAACENERDAIRELMNCYNLGGWTDALAAIKERDELMEALQYVASHHDVSWHESAKRIASEAIAKLRKRGRGRDLY